MDIVKAKTIAAKIISYKMYTCREVYKKLIQKGCNEEIAEQTVAQFCKANILNDEEYAKAYIHDAALIGFKGMFRIKQELMAKGVATSVIERAAALSKVDMEEQLQNYVELRFGDKHFYDRKEVEKAKAHLVRKGYSISDINRCFRKLNINVGRGDMD